MMPPDELSRLPNNVLDEILVRLPLRDAVRTSILSNKWRCNWRRLPELTLDQTLFETRNDSVAPTIMFTDIIYHLLTLHVGPITKFTLSVPNLGNCPKIDNLISFLSRNGIEHLLLQLSKDDPYKLPSTVFECLQLRHLTLQYCSFPHSPSFKGFNELIILKLNEVTISSELLESLISRSPLLEQLVLQISNVSNDIQINAPKLRDFGFTGRIKFISLTKAPLVKLSLVDTGNDFDAEIFDLAKYLASFIVLEHLHLNFRSVRFLHKRSDVPAKLSSPLNCLKHLFLTTICLDELIELKCALCLIRSSPYLQDLRMKIAYVALDDLSHPVPSDAVTGIPASFSGVTLNHLRTVKLEGITGTRPQMELIKILLSKSPMLMKMVIIQPTLANESHETRLEVLTEMIKFPRVSPKAEVDYSR